MESLFWDLSSQQRDSEARRLESDKRGLGKLSDPGEKTGVVTYILYGQLVFILIEKKKDNAQGPGQILTSDNKPLYSH